MNILSFYPLPLISYVHDPAAAIVCESGILWAYEEERLSRLQHALAQIPEKSATLALKNCALKTTDIDELVFVSLDCCARSPHYLARSQYVRELLNIRENIPTYCISHHLAHSGLAVLTSPFTECVFLTMDAGGDGVMGHWGVFQNGAFEIVEELKFSPALFYNYVSFLAGFYQFEDGKLMGLSAYEAPKEELLNWFRDRFWIKKDAAELEIAPNLAFKWDSWLELEKLEPDNFRRHKYFRQAADFGQKEEERELLKKFTRIEVAAAGQRIFEDLVHTAISNIKVRTGLQYFALSGGAFQNVVLNGKLRREPTANYFIPVAPHDAGLALGGALLRAQENSFRRLSPPVSPYTGPWFSDSDVLLAINEFGLDYEKTENVAEVAAEHLSKQKIVGWFQGRAEYGARALGARSILADPRWPTAKEHINQILKKRDWFMPYAPSILEEFGDEYFEQFCPSPYMNLVFQVRQAKRRSIAAAVHVDGSCRVHSVNASINPAFHLLLRMFFEKTGIPLVLNTSFNRHGMPMVATPRQAIQLFLDCRIDVLAIGSFVLENSIERREDIETKPDDFFIAFERVAHTINLLERHGPDIAGMTAPSFVDISNDGRIRIFGKVIYEPGFSEHSVKVGFGEAWNARHTSHGSCGRGWW